MPPATLQTAQGTNALVNQAQQQGQQQLAIDRSQQANAQNVYNQTNANANSAYNQLQGYTQNYASNYLNNLRSYDTSQQINPNVTGNLESSLMNATRAASNSAEAYANAPQAAAQMSNYSGATAGQETQNLANLSNSLQGGMARTNAQLTGLQGDLGQQVALMGQANTAANNMTGGTLTGYNDLYTQANAQMQNAVAQLNNIQSVASKQGYYNAQQISALQGAYNDYVTAQANMVAARAKAAEVASTNAYNYAQASQALQTAASRFYTSNPNTTAQNMANALGIPLDQAGAYLTGLKNGSLGVSQSSGSFGGYGQAQNSSNALKDVLQRQYGGYGVNSSTAPVGSASNPFPWVNLNLRG